ncbi:MAG: SMI1/KNR4 family protein [Deltaproteobacteria bacterium]|nr:SMI1/KNR4 family protein [Deltaproteobacteria bacterium]
MFAAYPILAADSVSEAEVDALEQQLGVPLPKSYREFVLRFGGAMVGSQPVYGLRTSEVMGVDDTIAAQTAFFRRTGWELPASAIVISDDGRGNPIWLADDGRVFLTDHDVGDQPLLATSFDAFVMSLLNESATG